MSKNITMQTKICNMRILKQTCAKHSIECRFAEQGQKLQTKLYQRHVDGIAEFQLPGWNYACAVTDKEGGITYDNYGGSWGKQEALDKFLGDYAEETAVDHYVGHLRGFLESSTTNEAGERVLEFSIPAYA